MLRVLEVVIPDYAVHVLELSGRTVADSWGHQVPVEYVERHPDFQLTAERILEVLRREFDGLRVGLRLLGLADHPGKSVDELVGIVGELGHDRYDPSRLGDGYSNLEGARIDLFALVFRVGAGDEEGCVADALRSIFFMPTTRGREPVRVDLGIVYDLSKLTVVPHRYAGHEHRVKRDGFVFADPARAVEAVLACLVVR